MFKHLLNLFFPKACAGCNNLLIANENTICTLCRHKIAITNHHLNPENEAFKKFYGKIPVEYVSAQFYFQKKGIVQEIIHKLKYKGQEEIGTVLGNWYADDLKEVTILKTADFIIPVPLHKKKFRERGYNQVTTFGRALSKEMNIKYADSILVRKVYSTTQSKKNLLGRSEGIETIFDICSTEKEHNKHFLLIDDVITTGATLEACSRALLKIPGAKISIVCIAMAQS